MSSSAAVAPRNTASDEAASAMALLSRNAGEAVSTGTGTAPSSRVATGATPELGGGGGGQQERHHLQG
jgi:hypothetical protein